MLVRVEPKAEPPSQQARRWAHSQSKQRGGKWKQDVCRWLGLGGATPRGRLTAPFSSALHSQAPRAGAPRRARSPAVSLHSKLMTLMRWKPELHSSPPE